MKKTSGNNTKMQCKQLRTLDKAALNFRSKLHDIRSDKSVPVESLEEYRTLETTAKKLITKSTRSKIHTPLHILLDPDYMGLDNSRLNVGILECLATKMNVNAKDDMGRTSLHMAVEMGRLDIVNFLLQKLASCHLRDNHGNTPLSIAVSLARVDLFEAMVKMSRWQICNSSVQFLLHIALKENHNTTHLMVEHLLNNASNMKFLRDVTHRDTPFETYCMKKFNRCHLPDQTLDRLFNFHLFPMEISANKLFQMIANVLTWLRPSPDMPRTLAWLLWHCIWLWTIKFRYINITITPLSSIPVNIRLLPFDSQMQPVDLEFPVLLHASIFLDIASVLELDVEDVFLRVRVSSQLCITITEDNFPLVQNEDFSAKFCQAANSIYKHCVRFHHRTDAKSLEALCLRTVRRAMINKSRPRSDELKLPTNVIDELTFEKFTSDLYTIWNSNTWTCI